MDCQKIVELWKQGYTVNEITDKIDAESPVYVSQILASKIGRQKIDTGKVRALHKAGWNVGAIAFECGGSRQEILNIIQGERT